jgi:outer membrane protein OmpA-like peptidoglycan-associated protein
MTGLRLSVGVLVALLTIGAASATAAQGKGDQSDHSGGGVPPPPPPPPPPLPPSPPPPPQPLAPYVVYFGLNQSTTTPEGRAVLQKAAADTAALVSQTNAATASYRQRVAQYYANMGEKNPDPAKNGLPSGAYEIREAVVGYTDTSGAADYNMALSERRAKAAAAALVNLGVSASSLDVSWKGETDLAVQTGDGVKEPMNRRVSIQVGPAM